MKNISPFFQTYVFESQLLAFRVGLSQPKSDFSIIQLKHHLLFKLIFIYKKERFCKTKIIRIKMIYFKILFFLIILTHSTKATRVLKSEEKLEFVRSSVVLIEGKDILDTCFILNYGYEAALPWPQV